MCWQGDVLCVVIKDLTALNYFFLYMQQRESSDVNPRKFAIGFQLHTILKDD
jgi:hypothetical protein